MKNLHLTCIRYSLVWLAAILVMVNAQASAANSPHHSNYELDFAYGVQDDFMSHHSNFQSHHSNFQFISTPFSGKHTSSSDVRKDEWSEEEEESLHTKNKVKHFADIFYALWNVGIRQDLQGSHSRTTGLYQIIGKRRHLILQVFRI